MGHININSKQNKFEEISDIIKKLRMQVLIVCEMKIDSSYTTGQFSIPGYVLYRNDRKKGGGGILAHVSSDITCKRLQTCRNYKTIEPVLLKIMLRTKNVILAGLYRPPKSLTGVYQQQLEDELNNMCNWLSLHGQMVLLIGDLNFESLGFGRGSRVEGTKSKVEGNMSRVEGNMSRVLKNENKIIKIKIKKIQKIKTTQQKSFISLDNIV